tara:strand:- start:45 stop:539 length:495 start_codon:yes stop_codon:yes gene_type:complete
MGIEIERRFIVSGEEWKAFTKETQEIQQCYLINEKKSWTVRLRIINREECLLTLKYPKTDISRFEFEYSIPFQDGQDLWEMSKYKLIKTRYKLNLNNGSWIVDCFRGENYPLVIAEVELASANSIIEKPNWCHKEISTSPEWSNAALAKLPISKRTIEKKHLIL